MVRKYLRESITGLSNDVKATYYSKNILIVLISFALSNSIGNAQYTDRVWCFGDSAGINFSDISNPTLFSSNLRAKGSCVSICDNNYNLIFYAYTKAGQLGNTTSILDSSHSLMMNGTNIVGAGWYNELLILPDPGYSNIFYLFSNTSVSAGGLEGFYYSKVDMSLNNGLGGVVAKNILISNLHFVDAMIGIKHGNGHDWWVILHTWNGTNTFYKYLVSDTGISLYGTQNIGLNYDIDLCDFAYNYNSSKFLTTTLTTRIQVLDFDRCTGMFSNPNTIQNAGFNAYSSIGCSISPNGNIAYVSNSNNLNDSLRLYQYDLTASNIFQSRQSIYVQKVPASGGFHALGPDGKIYISCLYQYGYPYADSIHNIYSDNISVINYPDSLGLACDFQPFSFNLGGNRAYWGLPNNPNYEASAWVGSPCDTLTGIQEISPQPPGLNVFYHPGFDMLFINAHGLSGKSYSLAVYDVNGRLLTQENGNLTSSLFTRDMNFSGRPAGMYFAILKTDKEQLSSKIIKR